MRIIKSEEIVNAVRDMCISANCHINGDIKSALENGVKTEKSAVSRGVLENLLKKCPFARTPAWRCFSRR